MDLNDTAEALGHAQAAIKSGAYDDALARIKGILATEPGNLEAQRLLGRLWLACQRFDKAVKVFEDVAKTDATEADLIALYQGYSKLRKFPEAEATLAALCTLSANPAYHSRLAKLKQINGKPREAYELIAANYARFPHNVQTLLDRFGALKSEAPLEALKFLEDAAPAFTNPAAQIPIYRQLIELRTDLIHSRPAQWDDAASTWEEVCQQGAPGDLQRLADVLQRQLDQGAAQPDLVRELASIAISRTDWQGADALFQEARRPNSPHIGDVVTFDPAFYQALENSPESDLSARLPPLVQIREGKEGHGPHLFLACDPVYFWRFALPTVTRLSSLAPQQHVHIHLLDGTADEWQRCEAACAQLPGLAFSMSAEASDAGSNNPAKGAIYYHSMRFVRFYEYLTRTKRAAWILDVDVEVMTSPRPFLERLNTYDVICWRCSAALEPWRKIQAGCLGVSASESGLRYARLVAAYVSYWRDHGIHRWGVDQAALFGVHAYLEQQAAAPRTLFLRHGTFELHDPGKAKTEALGPFSFFTGFKKFN